MSPVTGIAPSSLQDGLRLDAVACVKVLSVYLLLIPFHLLFPQLHTPPPHPKILTPRQQRILLETSRKPLPSHHLPSLPASKQHLDET